MATKEKKSDEFNAVTPQGIATFVHVWSPSSFQGSDEKQYSLVLVFPKGTDLSRLKQIVSNAAKKKFGDKAGEMLRAGKLSMPFRDGEDYSEYGKPFVPGSTFINIKSRNAPQIVDIRRDAIMDETEFYSGCKARASVYAHAYDTKGKRGVTLLLNNVQKMGDGDRLAGKRSAEEDFDDEFSGDNDTADLFGE